MGGSVTVMFALRPQRETTKSIRAANGRESLPAPGKHFMDVALVADIPNEFVFGRAENKMQRDGQLHHSKVWAQVPAVFRQPRNHLLPQLFSQFQQLLDSQTF